jgi:predicted double-glycine peptidase
MLLLRLVVLPFLLAALIRPTLAALHTRIDPDGVCLQQTAYTCGPASAVTGLGKLGLAAREGELAIWSYTSQTGTMPDDLVSALEGHYGKKGLAVEYRRFRSVFELKKSCPTLAVIKYSFLTDHFVTVLEATDEKVVVGDPLSGRTEYSCGDFAKKWRYTGIVLERRPGN